MARPKSDNRKLRTTRLTVLVTGDEMARIRSVADSRYGGSMSDAVRAAINNLFPQQEVLTDDSSTSTSPGTVA